MKKNFMKWAIVPAIAISGFISFSSFTEADEPPGGGGSDNPCSKGYKPALGKAKVWHGAVIIECPVDGGDVVCCTKIEKKK